MIRAAAINLGSNITGAVLSALCLYIAVQKLSVDDWGISAALLGMGQFVGAFLTFGTQTKALRDLSLLSAPQFRDRSVVLSVARLVAGTGIAATGVLVLFVHLEAGIVLVLAGGVFSSLGSLVPLIAERRYGLAGISLVLEKTISLVLVVALLPLWGAVAVPAAIGLSGLVIAVFVALVLRARGGQFSVGGVISELVGLWRGGFSFGVASVAPSALLLDVSIVTLVGGPATAGIYGIGSKLVAPLSVAATTIVQVLMPRIASMEPRQVRAPSPRVYAMLSAGLVLFCVVGVFVVPAVAVSLLGPRYEDAVWPIRWFVLNAGVVLFTRTMVTALQAWKRELLAAGLVAAQVVIALIGIALLAHNGASSAAIAVLGSNVVLAVVLVIVVRMIITRSKSDDTGG